MMQGTIDLSFLACRGDNIETMDASWKQVVRLSSDYANEDLKQKVNQRLRRHSNVFGSPDV